MNEEIFLELIKENAEGLGTLDNFQILYEDYCFDTARGLIELHPEIVEYLANKGVTDIIGYVAENIYEMTM